jgi:hypothetical protein
MMGDFTRQREYEGKEIFYLMLLIINPKRKKQCECEFACEKESNSRNTRSQIQKIATVRLNYFSKFLIIAKRIFDTSSACE